MMDALARVVALRDRPSRRIVGLSSGTSLDGIDAALVEIAGSGPGLTATCLRFHTYAYPGSLSARLLAGPASAGEVAELDVLVGDAFADAALALLDGDPGGADLLASHGQTIAHLPRSAGGAGATLQIGEPAILAERVGLPVISDFRARDMAAGGEGAPLVPLADFLLFGRPGRVRALQNIGGIANVTVVADRLEELVAFDTGPGNMPLDEATRIVTGGAEGYDAGGARAARGSVDGELLVRLLAHPFLRLPPPRSTGREAFGRAFVEPLAAGFAGRPDDLLATLTRFVAESIHRSYAAHVTPRFAPDEILVSGGGVHNATLMRHLAELFSPLPVVSVARDGVDPDAKEAVAFAVLGNQTLFGRPGNVPSATGARGPRVLGKLTLA
jgi:anhydro-N-acetylmuramic acid kinase